MNKLQIPDELLTLSIRMKLHSEYSKSGGKWPQALGSVVLVDQKFLTVSVIPAVIHNLKLAFPENPYVEYIVTLLSQI